MIILIPILLYLAFVGSLVLTLNYLIKADEIRQRLIKWIIGTGVVLFFPLGFLYFSYLFGLAIDNHFDVQKGSFLWYATMDNETITDFPVLQPVDNAQFNSIGGDSPNIGTGWAIEYQSQLDNEILSTKIIQYLESGGYQIGPVDETQFSLAGKNKKTKRNQLFSGTNEKGESLDLLIHSEENGTTRIQCSIVY